MTTKEYYTYSSMEQDIQSLIENINDDNWKPDVVVGIMRGGIIPAIHFSHYYEAPIIALEWSNRDSAVGRSISDDLTGFLFSESKILIIDDICDSGTTLNEIYDHLKDLYFQEKLRDTNLINVRTSVLHYNQDQLLFQPDYYVNVLNKSREDIWIIYPWE